MIRRVLLTIILLFVLWSCVVAPMWVAIRGFVFRIYWWMFPL